MKNKIQIKTIYYINETLLCYILYDKKARRKKNSDTFVGCWFFFPTISSAIAVRCILFLRNSSTIVQILNTMLLIQILVFYGTVIPVTSDKACDVCHCNGTRVDCRALSLKEIPTDIPNNTTWL